MEGLPRFAVALALGLALALGAVAQSATPCENTNGPIALTRAAAIRSNYTGSSAFKNVAYCTSTRIAAVVEGREEAVTGVLFVDLANPMEPKVLRRVLVGPSAGEETVGAPNSAAARNGVLALTLDGVPSEEFGVLRLYNMRTGELLAETKTCPTPDAVTWSKDGMRLYATCEGEPSTQDDGDSGSDPTLGPNPNGAITIINLTKMGSQYSFKTKVLDFQSYIDKLSAGQYQRLLGAGLRVDPRLDKASAGKDLEPEAIALDPQGKTAYVTLQENNGIVVIDLTPGKERVKAMYGMGYTDFGMYGIDPSDRDGKAQLRKYPNLWGVRQPDNIAYAKISGKGYLFTANEGDSKEELTQVKDLPLDPVAFPNASVLQSNAELGRLGVNPLCGIKGGYNASKAWNEQGPYEKLCTYGSRSFSIVEAATGKLVYDSGDWIDRIVLADPNASKCYNCDRESNSPDSRSDNSGVEPEALEVFKVGSRWYMTVGFERQGGMMTFEVTNPRKPSFVQYSYYRDYDPAVTDIANKFDLAPEGIVHVPSWASGTGKPYLLVSNEASGTLVVWAITSCRA